MQINSNNNSKITDRILYLLEIKGITEYKFSKDLGFSNGFLAKSRDISTEKYAKIIKYFPDVSQNWLLFGVGDAFDNEKEEPIPIININKLLDEKDAQIKALLNQNSELITIVSSLTKHGN